MEIVSSILRLPASTGTIASNNVCLGASPCSILIGGTPNKSRWPWGGPGARDRSQMEPQTMDFRTVPVSWTFVGRVPKLEEFLKSYVCLICSDLISDLI